MNVTLVLQATYCEASTADVEMAEENIYAEIDSPIAIDLKRLPPPSPGRPPLPAAYVSRVEAFKCVVSYGIRTPFLNL
jgi:hypothetical protein